MIRNRDDVEYVALRHVIEHVLYRCDAVADRGVHVQVSATVQFDSA